MITRHRAAPGGTDVYGDPVPGSSSSTVLNGAFTAPRESTELDGTGRAGVIVGLTMYAPPGTDLLHTDQVDVDGVLYRVEGEPGVWVHPHAGAAGVVVALERVDG